jgi:Ca2+-binding EF-hand superfamily protein
MTYSDSDNSDHNDVNGEWLDAMGQILPHGTAGSGGVATDGTTCGGGHVGRVNRVPRMESLRSVSSRVQNLIGFGVRGHHSDHVEELKQRRQAHDLKLKQKLQRRAAQRGGELNDSSSEMHKVLTAVFTTLDVDQDGLVDKGQVLGTLCDPDENTAALLHSVPALAGLLTPQHYAETFEAMVTNQDGFVDFNEMLTFCKEGRHLPAEEGGAAGSSASGHEVEESDGAEDIEEAMQTEARLLGNRKNSSKRMMRHLKHKEAAAEEEAEDIEEAMQTEARLLGNRKNSSKRMMRHLKHKEVGEIGEDSSGSSGEESNGGRKSVQFEAGSMYGSDGVSATAKEGGLGLENGCLIAQAAERFNPTRRALVPGSSPMVDHDGSSRHMRVIKERTNLVCEIIDSRTNEIASEVVSDYVLSTNEVVSRVLAMVAKERRTIDILNEIWGPRGAQITLVPARDFVRVDQTMSFMDLALKVRQCGDILLGYRVRKDSVVLNPANKMKNQRWSADSLTTLQRKNNAASTDKRPADKKRDTFKAPRSSWATIQSQPMITGRAYLVILCSHDQRTKSGDGKESNRTSFHSQSQSHDHGHDHDHHHDHDSAEEHGYEEDESEEEHL